MTEKKTVKRREPRAVVILDYLIRMQASDNLTDDDTLGTYKNQLLLKVAQEARRT